MRCKVRIPELLRGSVRARLGHRRNPRHCRLECRRERYRSVRRLPARRAFPKDPLSTFAIDVDTGSYMIAKRKLLEGALPPLPRGARRGVLERLRLRLSRTGEQSPATPPSRSTSTAWPHRSRAAGTCCASPCRAAECRAPSALRSISSTWSTPAGRCSPKTRSASSRRACAT